MQLLSLPVPGSDRNGNPRPPGPVTVPFTVPVAGTVTVTGPSDVTVRDTTGSVVAGPGTSVTFTGTAGTVYVAAVDTGTGNVTITIANPAVDTISVLDTGADPTGQTDSTTAIQAAINRAMPNGVVLFPTGSYLISSPLVIQNPDSTSNSPTLIPFLAGLNPPGRIGESLGENSSVSIACSDTFPVGQFALQFLGANGSVSPAGGGCINLGVDCSSRGAGILVHQPRRGLYENLNIYRTATPAPSADQPFGVSPAGAFSVAQTNGNACRYNRFANISVSFTGRHGFDYQASGSDNFFNCHSLAPGSANYSVGGVSSWYGCGYGDGEIGWEIACNQALVSGSTIGGSTVQSNAVVMYAMGSAGNGVGHILFEGCRFQANPPSGAGVGNAMLQVNPNSGKTINARFSGCTWDAYGNSSTVTVPYFAYVASGVEGKIEIDGGVVSGVPTAGTFVDDSGNSVLSVRGVQGFSPAGAQTAPTMPASGTAITNPFPFDCTVYIYGGTVTDIEIDGTSTGLTTASSGSASVRVAAAQSITLTYSGAPTWTWFGD